MASFTTEMQDSTEKSRGVFTFTNGDVISALATKNNQLLRGMFV